MSSCLVRFVGSYYWLIVLILLFHTTHTDSLNISSTATSDMDVDSDTDLFSFGWLLSMVISGFLGIILILIVSVHAIYHFYNDDIAKGFARFLYISFFVSYWITCIGYAFFRIDIILPMGTLISCKIGFYLTTNGVFLSKLILLTIFLVRIDLAFHTSALGYNRCFLSITMIIYAVGISVLNAAFMYVTWDYVKLISNTYNNHMIGMCTTGNDAQKNDNQNYILGLLFIGDVLFTIFVCGLFVYKLNVVLKMSSGHSDKSKIKPSKNETKRCRKLAKVIRKQTILVLFACLSSLLIFGGGAIFPAFSLLIPVDAIINCFTVWLMFSFADPVWNKILHFCCCCCCSICGQKDDFLMTMHSLSRQFSLRSISQTTTEQQETVPSTPQTLTKDTEIDTNFKNNIKSKKNVDGNVEMGLEAVPSSQVESDSDVP